MERTDVKRHSPASCASDVSRWPRAEAGGDAKPAMERTDVKRRKLADQDSGRVATKVPARQLATAARATSTTNSAGGALDTGAAAAGAKRPMSADDLLTQLGDLAGQSLITPLGSTDGRHVYQLDDGAVYFGEILVIGKKIKMHGSGTWTSADGKQRYEGQWSHGKRHGHGAMTYNLEGTAWYVGDWVDGKKQGRGREQYENGVAVYEGEFAAGKACGQGVCIEGPNAKASAAKRAPAAVTGTFERNHLRSIDEFCGQGHWRQPRVASSKQPSENEA
eukprot:gnl/TRDRNA2_/TRDRNA2_182666_c0_seq1.p1 gnl/TRDRNA2_/TRDRNA2_182666_c0~~gnl/TRDRNA2_/TRDRNA2_182666_c0_seq1.p1  ORF type:complete len:277 (+),score=52.59 gnl/TRDRNA2_/TRDRNA2_182666_c0_seq1:1-831(+)